MNRDTPKLVKIENDHSITLETDSDFICQLQKAILLSLQEQGYLNMMQFRDAEKKLIKMQAQTMNHREGA